MLYLLIYIFIVLNKNETYTLDRTHSVWAADKFIANHFIYITDIIKINLTL